jgi:tRNA pseudouridine38-40 synthase
MTNYQSIVAYDGTDFAGFQIQAAGQRTVQEALETSLRRLGWTGKHLSAAGRTDAGVHARGQVVGFQLDWRHAQVELTRAWNAGLPHDVAVWRTQAVADSFHARFSARRRRYSYRVLACGIPDPIGERFAWRVWPPPEEAALQQAASSLPGEHDFRAFGSPARAGGSTRRSVFRAAWTPAEGGWRFDIEANAFLYRMVRRLAAAQISVGQGRLAQAEWLGYLEGRLGYWEHSLAPARGLCLEEVMYDEAFE